jgi:hypothetical protein
VGGTGGMHEWGIRKLYCWQKLGETYHLHNPTHNQSENNQIRKLVHYYWTLSIVRIFTNRKHNVSETDHHHVHQSETAPHTFLRFSEQLNLNSVRMSANPTPNLEDQGIPLYLSNLGRPTQLKPHHQAFSELTLRLT